MLMLVTSGCDVITGVKSTPDKYKDHIRDIIITDRTIGEGDVAVNYKQVSVHYTGWLYDSFNRTAKKGNKFDSSYDRGEAVSFPVNAVIKGWTEGLQLMPVGSKYKFFIPQDLAYGFQQRGEKIKPFSALVFEVELLDIVK